MDFKKLKGEKKDDRRGPAKSPAGAPRRGADSDDGSIDMSPGGPPVSGRAGAGSGPGQGRHSIQDSKVWQEGRTGVRKLWSDYKTMLVTYFQRMPRSEQEDLITRLCLIVTMGVGALALMFFYGFVPQYVRIIVVPAVLGGAYWAGTKIVAPIMIVRYDQYLNREF